MEKCKQQYNRGYQRSGRSYSRQTGYSGNQSVWDDNTVALKCNCECELEGLESEQTCGGACPVQGDCPALGLDPLTGFPVAMAYVPWQKCRKMYRVDEGLYHGTIFPELNLGFYGKRC